MTLDEKIEAFEEYLDKLVNHYHPDNSSKPEKYYDYIERIVSLQRLILTLRSRKFRIDKDWIKRGDHE